MLYYQEIFASIQGESTSAGKPCVFVRLYGCPFNCAYCDQPQQKSDKKKIGLDNLISKIMSYRIPRVCITGGEPLMQKDVYPLIYDLVGRHYEVSVETNGGFVIDRDTYNRKFNYVMDVKCPSSGITGKPYYNVAFTNLANLLPKDEVKFVIGDRKDYEFARDVMRKYPTDAKILFSPVMAFDAELERWKSNVGADLVKWVLDDRISNIRIQLQIHKYLGAK